jgi:uncharacterized protein DUF4150
MGVGVNPPKTPLTKGSNGIATATLPNMCKMPGPPAPFVPAPLPNIGKSGEKPKGYTKKVKVEGNPVAIKGASFCSMGDMPSKGTGGGMVSANTHGPCKFISPGSMDVKFEGKNVHLLADLMTNNGGGSGTPANSATMMGAINPAEAAEIVDTTCLHCGKPLNDPSHKELKTNHKTMIKKAALIGAPVQGRTAGAMKVKGGNTTTALAGAVGGKGRGGDKLYKLFNLKTKKEIPLSKIMRRAVNNLHHNQLGECAEEKLLVKEFINKKPPTDFPENGVKDIKMGIVSANKGTPTEKDPVKFRIKCNKCEKILVSMTCTNEAKKGGVG